MPRINIEDSLWKDPRWITLCIKVGDQHKALGMLISAWTLAQTYWCPNKSSIPENVWKNSHLDDSLIESGLADRRPDGIYIRGSEQNFSWWFERREAGKRGGLARSSSAKLSSSSAKQNVPGAKQNVPSSSFSFSKDKENTYAPQVALVYELYPKKLGKGQGLKQLAREIRSDQDLADLQKAIKNYAASKIGTDPQYILKFSNFVKEWRDWVDHKTQSHGSSINLIPMKLEDIR